MTDAFAMCETCAAVAGPGHVDHVTVQPATCRASLCLRVEKLQSNWAGYSVVAVDTVQPRWRRSLALSRRPLSRQRTSTRVEQKPGAKTPAIRLRRIWGLAKESESLDIGKLTIENHLDQAVLYGSLQLSRDKPGLRRARRSRQFSMQQLMCWKPTAICWNRYRSSQRTKSRIRLVDRRNA